MDWLIHWRFHRSLTQLPVDLILLEPIVQNEVHQKKKKFKDLVVGRFDVTRVVYVYREDEQDTIFGKAPDFSQETIVN
jgi:hypothetical protein